MTINRTLSATLLALVATAGALHAQTKTLAPKQGAAYSYVAKLDLNQTVSLGGSETSTRGSLDASPVLHAEKVSKTGIDWLYEHGTNHLQMNGEMLPGGKIDTTVGFPSEHFSTDLHGTQTAADTSGTTLSAVVGGPAFHMLFDSWFSPTLTRTIKPGASWDESHVDTVVNGMIGIRMKTTTTTHYTFVGTTDTLGGKYVHVNAKLTGMTISGNGSFGGMKMVIDGDGSGSCDLYYAADGILKLSNIDCTSNYRMAVNGDNQMVVPVAQKVSGTVTRK